MAAMVQAVRRWRRPAWLVCAAFAAPLLLLAAAISPFHWVKGNWLAAAYPAALAAAAALALERPGWRRAAGAAGLGLALAGSIYVHLAFVLPALPFPAKDDLTAGWRELAARVEAERTALGGDAFVAGCSYKVSAELGYYLPGRPRTWSSEITGDHGLQYRYWFEPEALVGRAGILVLDPREKNTCARRAEACRPLEPLPPLTVMRGEDVVTTFQLWRCRYAGPPPPRRPRRPSPARGRRPPARTPRTGPDRGAQGRGRSSPCGRARSRTGPDRGGRAGGARP